MNNILKQKYIKKWIIAVIIISIAFILLATMFQYENNVMSYEHMNLSSSDSLKDIMSVDKIHPPPLYNFIDYHRPL
jgi:cytoskeletal protein RodZ